MKRVCIFAHPFHYLIRIVVRKMRDSNPRYQENGIPDFESSAFGHSANLPFCVCKVNNNI